MFQSIILLLVLINYDVVIAEKSYNEAQLLRLWNFNNITALDILTEYYGGSVWKEWENFVDISFEKENLNKVKDYINLLDTSFEILMPNIQEIIDYGIPNRTERSTTMNWKKYHKYGTIRSFLFYLAKKHKKITKLFNIGKSVEKRNLYVLRISNNVNKNKAIWLDGGIHAREWISPASVTYIANYLLKNWKTLPAKLKSKTWYIMPVINPDGYIYSHNKDRLWRKNRRKYKNEKCIGVDLNRNFNIDWNSSNQDKKVCSDVYRGTKAFSEPETRVIRKFLKKHKRIKAFLTYHSYGQFIIWPWGFTNKGIAPNASKMKKVGLQAKTNIKGLTGRVYTADRNTVLGLISGASDDWSKKVLRIPYTYTIELRDTGKYGFLLPTSQIIPTAKEALTIAKTVANAL